MKKKKPIRRRKQKPDYSLHRWAGGAVIIVMLIGLFATFSEAIDDWWIAVPILHVSLESTAGHENLSVVSQKTKLVGEYQRTKNKTPTRKIIEPTADELNHSEMQKLR